MAVFEGKVLKESVEPVALIWGLWVNLRFNDNQTKHGPVKDLYFLMLYIWTEINIHNAYCV